MVKRPIQNDQALKPDSAHLTSTVVLNIRTATLKQMYKYSMTSAGAISLIQSLEGSTALMKILKEEKNSPTRMNDNIVWMTM